LSPRTLPHPWVWSLVVLVLGLLVMPGAARATPTTKVVAWESCGGACAVPNDLSGVTAVAAGSDFSVGLRNDGTVVAWGCGFNYGECNVPSGLTGVTAIAAGHFHALALKNDGTVVAWGCGGSFDSGQCTVPGGLSGVTAIAAGVYHSLALKNDGTVVAWGCASGHDHGECSVPGGLSGVTAIAAGSLHSLALKNDGTVVAWGCGGGFDYGQCTVPNDLSGVIAIAAAHTQSLALKNDGTVVAWGCGDFDYGQCNVPTGLSGVTRIAAGYGHSLALKSDGTVVGWGCDTNFNFGQCSAPAGLAHVDAISAGDFHSLAVADWLDQTISFAPLPDRTWGYPGFFVVSAAASSGLPVSFAASGNCFLYNGSTVFISSAGSCTVTASQPGGLNYNPASDVSRTFTIARSTQSITFAPLADKTYGDPDFTVYASASSGSDVRFAARGNCTLSGTTVHLTGAGSCTVTASEPGSVNYEPAPDVSQTFAIVKAEQTIAFGPLPRKTYGGPDFHVHATASSGLPVSFRANGNCRVKATLVHLIGAGFCELTAFQDGNANYENAAVSRRFVISPAPCRVPKVVGKQLAAAKRSLAASHCRTGKVAYAHSPTRNNGLVLSQSRRPGKVLPARTKIDLVVARGQ
jgi:Regulator of chromosome condensation (RCC1) repeat/PASTA domain